MRDNKKHFWVFTFVAFILVLVTVPGINTNNLAFAQSTSEFTVLTGEQLNSPLGLTMLEKIEQSKKILADLMAGKQSAVITEQQKFVEEQRKIAKERLQVDLEQMNHKYRDYTPRAAFSKFLAGMNSTHHGIYWDQFNYMDNKVQLARKAMNEILQNGGTYQEARQAYFKIASTTRVELIQVNQDLNIKYGFADPEIQKAFDKYGKLPRTEK